jgi:hypothetical protein
MPKVGEQWIASKDKRALERGILTFLAPAIGIATFAAYAATGYDTRSLPRSTDVERALYPAGDTFTVRKLGNPASESHIARLCQKTMLDELPQLRAVWKGHMSLFGPRAGKPGHIEALFAALEDDWLRERWEHVRSEQKPGIISSYTIHSHASNLEGLSENARFAGDNLAENAWLRATLDIHDFNNASFGHDMALLMGTTGMIRANYGHYIGHALRHQISHL